jgi:hypothetical protein
VKGHRIPAQRNKRLLPLSSLIFHGSWCGRYRYEVGNIRRFQDVVELERSVRRTAFEWAPVRILSLQSLEELFQMSVLSRLEP